MLPCKHSAFSFKLSAFLKEFMSILAGELLIAFGVSFPNLKPLNSVLSD
ncbi:hypothetical protein NIES4074_65230 (plasmid) [Cylindrospermum sp. NIES-4074]|nr:hypothetical protein NIES4074_64060 [Cylindrospermum sp. NIES-4074]BAZ34009.1 hypothetical protein NIES4074_65230 [Cylindrospermum sp. NIES-4074]